MLNDITIGQYYPADSLIHRLDPRVKLSGTFLFIISVFLFHHPVTILLGTGVLAAFIVCSKIPFAYIVRGIKPIMILLLITGIFNLIFTPGRPVWQFGILTITKEGVVNTAYMMIRLIYLVAGTSVMTLTTTPNRMTDGMEKLFSPLRHLKVPVHEIAMMMSIALRFIPILVEETDKIQKAQMARGADFETGNFLRKVKNMIPLLVPLFVSAWRRASDLAMAMESRCYHGGEGRTKMKPLMYTKSDYIAYGMIWTYFLLILILRVIL